jgi:RNA-directed DNA polymerase
MTASENAGAPSGRRDDWNAINWGAVRRGVRRLQVRIAKAVKQGRHGKVKSLQWILTHSYYAKLLAVKRVTSNQGKRTPGVDGVLWSTPRQKIEAAHHLRRHGYRAQPLRRIYIPKKQGTKLRPLSIPVMSCRALQALHKLALDPIAETLADPNSYGFREYRSCADAIQQCFCSLAKRDCAEWLLAADIRACFDQISHEWLLANIPMDQRVLRQWLQAGYIEGEDLYPTDAGTPQGGIISPVLANMALDGLEAAIRKAVPLRVGSSNTRTKVNVIRYADDLVSTGGSKEILEDKVLPALRAFLAPRGLELTEEKTRILRIEDGVDFLGQNLRKYHGKFLIKPTREAVQSLLGKLRALLRKFQSGPVGVMIQKLNSVLRGWANFHRHVVSADTFRDIDTWLFHRLRRWLRRRHPKQNLAWLHQHYWARGDKGWFAALVKGKKKNQKQYHYRLYRLIRTSSIAIVRYKKVQGAANPYDPAYDRYFQARKAGNKYYAAKGSATRCEVAL